MGDGRRKAFGAWILTLTCCAPVNLHGREINVARYPFTHDGHALEWFVGEPQTVSALESDPLPRELPTVIFIDGDGSHCQAFDEDLWRRFLVKLTGAHRLVRARSHLNTICETDAFARADYAHRAGELDALVSSVTARYTGAPLFLLGSSAGAELALGHAERHPSAVRGIVNLGGGFHELSLLLPVIARQKGESVEPILAAIADLRASGPSDAPFWGRNRAFWHQMFFSDALARWQRHDGPVLVVHGTEDRNSVPFSSVREGHRTMGDNVELHVVEGAGHDVMQPAVMKRVDAWITRQVATRP